MTGEQLGSQLKQHCRFVAPLRERIRVSGRFGADHDHDLRGGKVLARGETVGEIAFFTGEPRMATIDYIKDAVLPLGAGSSLSRG